MINAYGIWLTIILAIATYWASRRLCSHTISLNDIENMILIAAPATLIGARVHHVITDWYLYSDNIRSTLYVWNGGAGLWGGVLLGFTSVVIYCVYRGIAITSLLQSVAVPLFFVFSIGRFANVFNHELLPYAYYESFVSFNILLLIMALERILTIRKYSIFFISLILYAATRLVLEFVRLEPRYGLFTVNQYVSVFAIFLLLVTWRYIHFRNR